MEEPPTLGRELELELEQVEGGLIPRASKVATGQVEKDRKSVWFSN